MQNLGDFFSDELKSSLADENFKIGAVLRLHDADVIPPKTKIWVVVGFDSEMISMAHVYVNSEINLNIFRNQRDRDLHLELDTTNRDFLDHTSYVDCSQLKKRDAQTIKTLIAEDTSLHIGELSPSDLADVLNKIKTAHTIPLKVKKKFGLI